MQTSIHEPDPSSRRRTAALFDRFRSTTAVPFYADVPVDKIRPNPGQPRKSFDEESLRALAGSIERQGLLYPVLVQRKGEDDYEIIAGERRWRAHLLLGRAEVPCRIFPPVDDLAALMTSLVENVHREDLRAIEKADAIQLLMETGHLTVAQVSEKLSLSRMQVYRMLRMHQLPMYIQDACYESLSEKHARALYMLNRYPEVQQELYDIIQSRGLSGNDALAQAEQWLKELPRKERAPAPIARHVAAIAAKMERARGRVSRMTPEERAAWRDELNELRRLIDLLGPLLGGDG